MKEKSAITSVMKLKRSMDCLEGEAVTCACRNSLESACFAPTAEGKLQLSRLETLYSSLGISAARGAGTDPCAERFYRCELGRAVVLGSRCEAGNDLYGAGY